MRVCQTVDPHMKALIVHTTVLKGCSFDLLVASEIDGGGVQKGGILGRKTFGGEVLVALGVILGVVGMELHLVVPSQCGVVALVGLHPSTKA